MGVKGDGAVHAQDYLRRTNKPVDLNEVRLSKVLKLFLKHDAVKLTVLDLQQTFKACCTNYLSPPHSPVQPVHFNQMSFLLSER